MTEFYYVVLAVIAAISIVVGMFPITKVIAEDARQKLETRMKQRAPKVVTGWYMFAARAGVSTVEQLKKSGQLDHIIKQTQTITKTEVQNALKQLATESAIRLLKAIGYKNPDEMVIKDIVEQVFDNDERIIKLINEFLSQRLEDQLPAPAPKNIIADMEGSLYGKVPGDEQTPDGGNELPDPSQ